MPDIKPVTVKYAESSAPSAKFARSMQAGVIKTGKNQIVSSLGYTSNVTIRKDYKAPPVRQFTPYKPEITKDTKNNSKNAKSKDETAEQPDAEKAQSTEQKKEDKTDEPKAEPPGAPKGQEQTVETEAAPAPKASDVKPTVPRSAPLPEVKATTSEKLSRKRLRAQKRNPGERRTFKEFLKSWF